MLSGTGEGKRSEITANFFSRSRADCLPLQCRLLRQRKNILTFPRFCQNCKNVLPGVRIRRIPCLFFTKRTRRTICAAYFWSLGAIFPNSWRFSAAMLPTPIRGQGSKLLTHAANSIRFLQLAQHQKIDPHPLRPP